MTREPEEEEAAGAAALARGGRGSLGRIQARRPPLWLLCLAVGWLLGAGADAEFSILDEAQVLASQMRRLAAEELGVVTMQVRVPPTPTPCARELARHIPPRSFAQSRVPSPVQVTLTEHRPRPHAQSTLCPGHLWPLRGSSNYTPTPSTVLGPLLFLLCRSPCPLHRTHFPCPSPSTALLSRRGFSGSFAPPFLICTNFPRTFFFLNPAATPTNSPFPSLCIHPRADGPAWLGRFSEASSLYPLDQLFGSPRQRRTNGRPEGRHRRVRSCSRATWAR